jgi:zinc transporter ZupT
MRRRAKKNPITEAAIYAIGTASGIILGTIAATYIVEKMRSSGVMPTALPPAASAVPPPGYIA